MAMSKYVESVLDKLSYGQMIELAVSLCALTRLQVMRHILEYDFDEEDIWGALEEMGLNPDDLE